MKRIAVLIGMMMVALTAFAREAAPLAEDPQVEARLISIAEELRCLVCQNESLIASRADLAMDLKRQVREQIQAGKSDDEIRKYMVDRYGDFVLYRPPVKASTLALWIGPFVLLLVGFAVVWRFVRRRRAAPGAAPLSADDEARADRLLGQK